MPIIIVCYMLVFRVLSVDKKHTFIMPLCLSRKHRHPEVNRFALVGGEQYHQRPIADAAVYQLAGAAVAGQQIMNFDARQSMLALEHIRRNAPTPLEHLNTVCRSTKESMRLSHSYLYHRAVSGYVCVCVCCVAYLSTTQLSGDSSPITISFGSTSPARSTCTLSVKFSWPPIVNHRLMSFRPIAWKSMRAPLP